MSLSCFPKFDPKIFQVDSLIALCCCGLQPDDVSRIGSDIHIIYKLVLRALPSMDGKKSPYTRGS